ncbi:MAG TPA: acyl carrier protein [Polyangiales bacterium]|nr:acyl carrier protein [Polyangiales bacterium]
MASASTLERLVSIAATRFKKDVSTLAADGDVFESLGIDSMQVLSLLSELESTFGVEVPDYELREVRTFAQLAACIDRRL